VVDAAGPCRRADLRSWCRLRRRRRRDRTAAASTGVRDRRRRLFRRRRRCLGLSGPPAAG